MTRPNQTRRAVAAVAGALTLIASGIADGAIDDGADVTVEADRAGSFQAGPIPTAPPIPTWTPGDCGQLIDVFRWHGATERELDFFFGWEYGDEFNARVLWWESGCGLDTYNDSSGDTGVCMFTWLHSEPGYMGGVEYGDGGWIGELFGMEVGKRHGGKDRDHPNHVPACLFLIREGAEPGEIHVNHWNATRFTRG